MKFIVSLCVRKVKGIINFIVKTEELIYETENKLENLTKLSTDTLFRVNINKHNFDIEEIDIKEEPEVVVKHEDNILASTDICDTS